MTPTCKNCCWTGQCPDQNAYKHIVSAVTFGRNLVDADYILFARECRVWHPDERTREEMTPRDDSRVAALIARMDSALEDGR